MLWNMHLCDGLHSELLKAAIGASLWVEGWSFIPYLLAYFQFQPSTKSEAPLAASSGSLWSPSDKMLWNMHFCDGLHSEPLEAAEGS